MPATNLYILKRKDTKKRVSDAIRNPPSINTEYNRNLFLTLDPSSIMPGKRTVATERAAQREWKRKADKTEEAEEEENKEEPELEPPE